jgi:hypothetical protein
MAPMQDLKHHIALLAAEFAKHDAEDRVELELV